MERKGGLNFDETEGLLDLLLVPTPATHVRLVLKAYRSRGWGFEQAWAQALRTLPRDATIGPWRTQLHAHKPYWREAYESVRELEPA